nr:hypothetical protein [Tanacetum cinerariifolium]
MTTLAEHIIVAGAENHPPMLEKSMYDSWASRIRLFIKGNRNGRMMFDSIDNGPLVYPTVKENRQTRPKKYSELTEAQQLQDNYDVQATKIILHGLPHDVVKLYEYYQRFSQLINDMHTIGMTMQQVQVNTKFLNALSPEWSKFITDVKLANSLYTTNYDQLYAYLSQHERHANELDYGVAVPTFQQGDDLIECINKAMAFLSVVVSRFLPSNNQLKTSFNPRNHATIQDCSQPKRPRSSAWFKEKLMLAKAQEAAFQTEDLDANDSDYDDISSAKAFLMVNLSSCDPNVLSEVPYSDSYPKDMINQDVQDMPYSEQAHIDDYLDNETNSDINTIPYS